MAANLITIGKADIPVFLELFYFAMEHQADQEARKRWTEMLTRGYNNTSLAEELGRAGGKKSALVKTAAKAKASRENGRKGGRPRKNPASPVENPQPKSE